MLFYMPFCFLADINECLEAVLAGDQPCDDESMVCRDTPGNFTCLCPSGTEFTNGECREPGMSSIPSASTVLWPSVGWSGP